jgi:predicted small lipoprotein YifL
MFCRSRMILGARFPVLALVGVFGGFAVVSAGGCGQKGPLYIPANDPAAAQRATLPGALLNTVRTPKTPQPPASAASAVTAASAPDAAASAASSAQPAP